MGSSTKAIQRRSPPSGARTQKVLARVSPTWRLRTRSTSHDNELFRMGLRKDAHGDWAVSNNRVPAGLVNAMRTVRIRSESMVKREPSVDVDIDMADAPGESADPTEGSVVYEYEEIREEIRVYLDVERELEGGFVYVDERGMNVETVMRSVEAKSESKADTKMVGSAGVSGNNPGDAEPFQGGIHDSLTSVPEGSEGNSDRTDGEFGGKDDQQRLTANVPDGATGSGSVARVRGMLDEHKQPCVFSFAGCTSLWRTKNAWKRHAMKQHLGLESYHCTLCRRDDVEGVSASGNQKYKRKKGRNPAWAIIDGVGGQVFTRKDSYTQHVKRMHCPKIFEQPYTEEYRGLLREGKRAWLKGHQAQALVKTGREAPNLSICPRPGCNTTFAGRKGWDDRLEHIWKHLERNETISTADMGKGGVEEWALSSGVVEAVDGRLLLREYLQATELNEEDAPEEYE